MRGKTIFFGSRLFVILVVAMLAASSWAAPSWRASVVHHFNGTDGSYPQSPLIFDAAGNLYGTTTAGGAYGGGTVFELSPAAGGGWTQTVLYSFYANASDGFSPLAGLVFDAAGNLFGTTIGGGLYEYGTVFELSPKAGGGWTETILHNFGDGTDGAYPAYGSLIFDAAGNLYGTTSSGGAFTCQGNGGCGTVFELSPRPGGEWTESVLHNFGVGTDGYSPEAGLVQDINGNLFGTTTYGGTVFCAVAEYSGCGTIFELTPAGGGSWTETVVHDFSGGMDGATSIAGLTLDAEGNFYGTTEEGGPSNLGTVFRLSPAGLEWSESVIHSFSLDAGGWGPGAGTLVLDAAGNLYGTLPFSDRAFELSASGVETALYTFDHNDSPWGGLIPDADGNLYGTTWYGGLEECDGTYPGCGKVFKLSPVYPCTRCSAHSR